MARQSPSNTDTDRDLLLMLGGERWPRSPEETAQPFLANLHRAKDVCDSSYLKEEPWEVKHSLIT